MKHEVIQRNEMIGAVLELGGEPIDLTTYATTGLIAVTIGPRGCGKTNTGQVMAEQLSIQGWVSVLIDPENELASMYGSAVKNEKELRDLLISREKNIIVVEASDAGGFVPYGRVILEIADELRKPIFVMIDEGQIFSSTKRSDEDIIEAANIINQFADRGRKRSLDMFMTATRYTGSLHRSIFANKNLTLVGCQEDPAVWSSLASQFRASDLGFSDLNSLAPSEFFCFSRSGVEKVRMPMSEGLKRVDAIKSKISRRKLPMTFSQWNRALMDISTDRLETLSAPVINLLGAVAGLSTQQMLSGSQALQDEMEARA